MILMGWARGSLLAMILMGGLKAALLDDSNGVG